ncbi:MAG: hypothetical protein Q8Q04_02605 [archaeon]|nr:hypothetical protein [archaeon]
MQTQKKKSENTNKRGAIAISEILILLVSIFAFVWLVSGVPSVSASGGDAACVGQGGKCTAPIGASAGSACPLNGGEGKVVYNLCKGDYNNFRCCVPKNSLPEVIGPDDIVPYVDNIKFLEDIMIPSNNKELAEAAIGVGESGGASEGFLGGFGNLGGIVVNTIGTIGASAGTALLFRQIANWADANGDITNAATALGAAGGAFSYLLFVAAVNPVIAGIVAGIAFIITAFFSKTDEEIGTVIYYCNPWDAQTGGKYCELCNDLEVPCSEYQCRSLGQACNFVPSSEDRDGGPLCLWNNSNDIDPPVIRPNTGVLTVNYNYKPSNAVSFPDKSTNVKIINSKDKEGCLSPFSQVTFGVTLDEPAKCRLSFDNRNSYEEMSSYFGKAGLDYNHTQILLIPELNTSVGQDNQISAYVRCQDTNGNANPHNFIFEMCVQEGPDINPPFIQGTSIENDSKVSFNVTEAQVDFYVNEPANCKWSFSPERTYDQMENNMSCATESAQINIRLSYTCSANLSGIRQNEKTSYYAKCQDVSERKNTNVQNYVYSLSASKPLAIIEASPNNTIIKDSTSPAKITLEAKTIGGALDGNALCYWSTSGNYGEYTIFDETSSNEHSTDVYLTSGNYNFFIKCDDLAGNADTEEINFDVEIDSSSPLISRAYYEEGYMKIITNEKAECKFSTDSCFYQFEDGVDIPSVDEINHRVGWQTESDLYIKCQDIYGNQPASADECSIVVRAYTP